MLRRDALSRAQAAEVALVIVDNFFKQLISKLHGGLSKDNQRDFDLPLHSDSCHKLLSNGGNLRESFTVY